MIESGEWQHSHCSRAPFLSGVPLWRSYLAFLSGVPLWRSSLPFLSAVPLWRSSLLPSLPHSPVLAASYLPVLMLSPRVPILFVVGVGGGSGAEAEGGNAQHQ
jgi:hypothetical protein